MGRQRHPKMPLPASFFTLVVLIVSISDSWRGLDFLNLSKYSSACYGFYNTYEFSDSSHCEDSCRAICTSRFGGFRSVCFADSRKRSELRYYRKQLRLQLRLYRK